MKRFRVRNLERWQHYKDRTPPWIKLHRDILTNYDFGRLQDASKAHAMCLMVLASQTNNLLPWDAKWLATRINATTKIDLEELKSHGVIELVQDASEALAERTQSAMRETETETETETEEKDICAEPLRAPAPAMTFSVVGPGGPRFGISTEFVAECSKTYPGLDVMAEFAKAALWLKNNPAKRKTARGIPKFLGGWLERAQNGNGQRLNGHSIGRPSGARTMIPARTPDAETRAKYDAINDSLIPEDEELGTH